MLLENLIQKVELDREHPIQGIIIALTEPLLPQDKEGRLNPEHYERYMGAVEEIHTLYRQVARKITGKRGVQLPPDVVSNQMRPLWMDHNLYCFTFVDRSGERCADLTLADEQTFVISNSYPTKAREIEQLYDLLLKYVPRS